MVVSSACHWLDADRCIQISLPGQHSALTRYSQTAWRQKRKGQLEKAQSSLSWLRSSAERWHLRCQLDSNHVENWVEFLGVEMLKIRECCHALLCGLHLTDVFWTRRMRLLQKNLRLNMVEISDLRIPCFGFVFRVLVVVRSFCPSLIHLLHIPIPNATVGTTNMASKASELSVNLNCFFHNLPSTTHKLFRPEYHRFPYFFHMFLYFFMDFAIIFAIFRCFLHVFAEDSPFRPPRKTTVPPRPSPRKPRPSPRTPSRGVGLSLGEIIGIAAQLGDVPALRHFLGVDPDSVREKTGHLGPWPQKTSAELRVCGWWWLKGGFKGGRRNDPKILKFGALEKSWPCNSWCIFGYFWDSNFQTTIITDEFCPGDQRGHGARGTTRNKMDFFQGIWQQNMIRHHSTNGLYKKDVKWPQLFWALYTDFRTSYQLRTWRHWSCRPFECLKNKFSHIVSSTVIL